MDVLGFLFVYLVIEFCMPLVDKSCEFCVTLIHLGTTKLSIRLAKLQEELKSLTEPIEEKTPAIGFQIYDEIEEDYD